MNTAYLKHYGVKGMKWGVRKKRELVGKKGRKIEKKATKKTERKKMSPAKKKALIAAGAVATAAVIGLVGNKALNVYLNKRFSVIDLKTGAEKGDWISNKVGLKMLVNSLKRSIDDGLDYSEWIDL